MSKIIRLFLIVSAISAGTLLSWSGHAQNTNDHQHTHGAVQPTLSEGEVKKVDVDNAKVTIKHGDIPHLDMPAMTMVFTVKDKAMLENVKPGNKVRFLVIQVSGKLLVTDIQAGQ